MELLWHLPSPVVTGYQSFSMVTKVKVLGRLVLTILMVKNVGEPSLTSLVPVIQGHSKGGQNRFKPEN